MIDSQDPRLSSLEKNLMIWSQAPLDSTEKRKQAHLAILRVYQKKEPRLDLSGLGLMTLPNVLKHLPFVTDLCLCNNQLVSFPKGKQFAEQLMGSRGVRAIKLRCAKNLWQEQCRQVRRHEKRWINQLKQLSNLKHLDLSHNPRLTKLPRVIGHCQQLKELDISDTKIAKLPAELLNLKKLRKLAFRSAPVQRLPCSDGRGFKSLEELSCESSRLRRLPSAHHYKKLKELKGANTLLEKLPKDFGRLKQLETLDLSNTPLKKIPRSFRKLAALRRLSLKNARLKKVAIKSRDLPNLRFVDLCDNQLTQAPKGFERPGVEAQLTGNLFKSATPRSKSNRLVHQLVSSSLSKEGNGGLLPIASNGMLLHKFPIIPSAPPAWAA